MGTDSGHITKVDELIINMDAANSRSYTSGSTSCNCLVSTVSGTLEGGTSFTSEYKGGWVFGGSNDYINLGNRTKINPELNSFTTNIFFKIDSNSTSSNIIASKGNGVTGDIGWLIYYSNTNDILTVRCNGNNTPSQRAAQYIPINKGQVYMVTMVINRTDNTIKGYLNGSNVGWINGNYIETFSGNSISGFGSITNSDDFLIGERPQLNLPMYGTIYLFQTYNFALSEAQVYRNFRFFGGRYDLSVPPPPPSFNNDYSFEFDGTDDYTSTSVDSLNSTTTFTISFWGKKTSTTKTVGLNDKVTDTNKFLLYWWSNGTVYLGARNGSSNSSATFALSYDSDWHHFMGVYVGGTSLKLYVDGVLRDTVTSSVPSSLSSVMGDNITIGYINNTSYTTGNIDEVSIFDTALSDGDISSIYGTGIPNDIDSLNPVAWYRMGDNGAFKSPQWLLPSNENKDKASNYSMSFDGTNDEIVVPYNSNLQFGKTQAYSVSCWIYAPSYVISSKMILGTGNWATSAYLKNDTHSGGLYSVMWVMGGTWPTSAGYHITVKSGFVLSQATWHNIIITYDGSELGAGLKMYVDGGTPTVSTDNWGANTQNSLNSSDFRISLAAATGWPGYMDEISVWRSELTSTHIAEIYNSGTPVNLNALPTAPVPTTWWNLGENAIFKDPQWLIPNNENKDKISNYSMSFDGADDYYDVGNRPYIDSTSPFSVSCWVKVDDFSPNQFPTLIQLRSDTQYSWMMALSDHASYLGVWMGSVNGWSRIKTSTPASTFIGNWVHIVATYNGSGPTTQGNFTIYVNGLGTTLSSAGGFVTTNQVNSFGAGVGPGTLNLLEGSLSDISVWDIELNSSQVTDIYNSGVPTDISSESGLVSYWRMGEDATYDNSLTQFTIPDIKQVLYSTKSFYFNGSSSYVTMGDVLDFEMTDTLSISCWMKKPVHGYDMLVTKAIGSGDYKGYLFWCRNSRIDFAIVADLSNYIDVYANVIFELDRWHHVAVTYDGSTNASGVKLYQDGVEVSIIIDVDTYTSGSVLNSHPFQIGTRNSGEFFDGNIDEVTVWDEVLTSGNITSIYNFNTPNDVTGLGISGLVGYWHMGEGATFSTNWTIPDDSANSNSGVSVNAVEADVKSLTPTSDAFSINMDIYDRVGDAPGSSGNTVSYNMDIYDRVGDAPNSENNALSYNMVLSGRTTDVPT